MQLKDHLSEKLSAIEYCKSAKENSFTSRDVFEFGTISKNCGEKLEDNEGTVRPYTNISEIKKDFEYTIEDFYNRRPDSQMKSIFD